MSKTKVDDSRADVLGGADLHDVRMKDLDPEIVEISSASEDESEAESENNSEDESGSRQDGKRRDDEGDSSNEEERESKSKQSLLNGNSRHLSSSSSQSPSNSQSQSQSGNDVYEDATEPTFGDLVSANAPDPIDVEGPFEEQHMSSHSRLTSRNLQALSFSNATSLGTVLTQALKTNDIDLLDTCLAVKDLSTIRATVERLDSTLATALLQKLAERLYRRPGRAGSLLVWIQWTIVAHGGYLATQTQLMRKMSLLHKALRQRSNGLQPLLSLKGKLDMLEAQLEIRRTMQATARIGNENEDEDDENVIYVEGQDEDDSENDENQTTSASSRRKRRVKLNGERRPSNGLDSLSNEDESSEDMPTMTGGELDYSNEDNDESDSESNDMIDDEAEETDDDSGDEEEDESVDHDDISTDQDEDEDSELEMPPAKRFAGMSRTSNAPKSIRVTES